MIPDPQARGLIVLALHEQLLHPLIPILLGHFAQHRIDQPGRPCADRVADKGDRFVDGRMAAYPHAQQLVGAQPQCVEDLRVELVQVAVYAAGQDEVVGAAGAQCAVGQLSGEGRILPAEPGRTDLSRQDEVAVGIIGGDRSQDLVGDQPCRVRPTSSRRRGSGAVLPLSPLAAP